jgi:hypothetical protein
MAAMDQEFEQRRREWSARQAQDEKERAAQNAEREARRLREREQVASRRAAVAAQDKCFSTPETMGSAALLVLVLLARRQKAASP